MLPAIQNPDGYRFQPAACGAVLGQPLLDQLNRRQAARQIAVDLLGSQGIVEQVRIDNRVEDSLLEATVRRWDQEPPPRSRCDSARTFPARSSSAGTRQLHRFILRKGAGLTCLSDRLPRQTVHPALATRGSGSPNLKMTLLNALTEAHTQ